MLQGMASRLRAGPMLCSRILGSGVRGGRRQAQGKGRFQQYVIVLVILKIMLKNADDEFGAIDSIVGK